MASFIAGRVSVRGVVRALAICAAALPAAAQFTVGCSGNVAEDLRAAIRSANASGGTIQMQGCDAVFNSTDAQGVGSALPKITNNVTILGTGTDKIRRGGQGAQFFRLFYVETGATLTLKNLTVSDGWAIPGPNSGDGRTAGDPGSGGGAIDNRGTIVIDNVTFQSNKAGHGGSGENCDNGAFGHTGHDGGAGGDGGAIRNTGTATIRNSRFNSNEAGLGGTGGDCTGTDIFSVSRSVGSGGSGGRGGAIRSDSGARLLIQYSFFRGNTGGTGGSMGHVAGNNSGAHGGAGGAGGAISSDGTFTIEDTSVEANRGGAGGAATVDGSDGGNGGGISITGGTMTIRRTGLTSNVSGLSGSAPGARAGQGAGMHTAVSGTIENLTAYGNIISAPCPTANGAGLYVQSPADVLVTNATFLFNHWSSSCQGDVSTGAAVYAEAGATVRLRNSILYTNTPTKKSCAGSGSITDDSVGHNISWSDGTFSSGDTFGCPGTFLSTNPRLGTRSNPENGPQWIALFPESPAINAADTSKAPATDIRGAVRPQGPAADIGSTESLAPILVAHPQPATVNENSSVTFKATVNYHDANQNTPATTWQQSTDGGANWSDFAGSACAPDGAGLCTSTLLFSNVSRTLDGTKYRAVFRNVIVPNGMTTSSALLTVRYGADFVTDLPVSIDVNIGQEFPLSVTYTASPAIASVLWEVSKNNGATWQNLFDVGAHPGWYGTTSETFRFAATRQMYDDQLANKAWRYRVTLSGGYSGRIPAVSRAVRMNVTNDPQAPYFDTGFTFPLPWPEASPVSMSFFPRGNPPPVIGWQVSKDEGLTWTNLSNAAGSGYQFNTSTTAHPDGRGQLLVDPVKSLQDGWQYRSVLNGGYFSDVVTERVSLPTSSTLSCPDKVLPEELYSCTLQVNGIALYGPRARKPAGIVLWRGAVLDPPDTTHCPGQPPDRGCCELDLTGACTLTFRAPATVGTTNTLITDYGTQLPFRYYLLDQVSTGTTTVITASCVAPLIDAAPEDRTIATEAGECFAILPDLRSQVDVTERGCAATVTQTPAPGTHVTFGETTQVTFTVTSDGGSRETHSLVSVVDDSVPAITLIGSSTVTLQCHEPYVEQGAFGSQVCGDQRNAIVTQSDVDTTQPGSYLVVYQADFGALGLAVGTRVVNVIDSDPPAISLNGPASLSGECGTFVDPGAHAEDACSGPVEATVVIYDANGDAVATPSIGTFTYRYSARDTAGNVSSIDRIVQLQDTTDPRVETPTFALPVVAQCRSTLTLPVLAATDACDGPVPVTATSDADVNVPGTYTILYSASDSAGNQGERSVPLVVSDTVKPIVTLNGASTMTMECHTSFVNPGATALDACTGALSIQTTGTLNQNAVGEYTVTYSATDSSGNTESVTRTVNVVDTTKPVIALNGASSITVECHTPYTEWGALAFDACMGTYAATESGTVNANVPGTYTVTYTASDASGNAATPVTRTVNVVDTTKPVISLHGNADVTLECHTAYVEAGATAVDGCALSFAATAAGSVDSNTIGTYTITYTATDPSGNIANVVTRTVHVVDTTAPVIALNGAGVVTVECHTGYADAGATATDACAGATAVSATGTVDVNTPGTYTITYNSSDPSGNAALAQTRTVIVSDTTKPAITIAGDSPLRIECHGSYVDPGATATDSCFGTISVTATGAVDVNTPGSYTVTYSAVDAAGNTQSATRIVNVADATKPVITLTGEATVHVECHTSFTDLGATATDSCDGTSAAAATGTVDAETPGTYTITYSARDASGNDADPVTRTVIVGDTTTPVITLTGEASMTVECHTSFTDPGAVVDDACGGSSTAGATGAVDVNTVGSYTITYSASDASGNSATAVTRTVHVVDTTKPSITLIGASELTMECHTSYIDAGATANDSCAGTINVVTSGTVDPNAVGTYTLTYTATDPSNNVQSATRTIHVVDTTAPVITLTGNAEVTAECHAPFADPGATATDSCTGTFVASVSGSVDANTPGTYTLTYSATDASGNSATPVTRTIRVVDTTKPVVVLTGEASMTVECHTSFTDAGATVEDACDGSSTAVATGTVDANTPGTYTIIYSALDASGNAAVAITRTVHVVDTTKPSITVTGATEVTTECHTSYTDAGATANDSCVGAINVVTSGTVDSNTPGTYTLTYTATDPSNNVQIATRTIHVVDATAPVITLTGNADVTIECHTTFADPGATATDSCSGTFAASASGPFDPNTPGTYTLTYSASDASGNAATPVTRTVHVVDSTAPVFTTCAVPVISAGDENCAGVVPDFVSLTVATDSCSSATLTQSPRAGTVLPLGTHVVTITATDASGNHSACQTTFTVEGAPSTITLTAPVSQYSDELTLTAVINGTFPPVTGGSVMFSVNGQRAGMPVIDSRATLHLSGSMRPGTHKVDATFSGEGCAAKSFGTATAVVIREDAIVTYEGPSVVPAASGTANAVLTARVTQQEDGAAGDLTFAAVVFELYRGNTADSSPDLTVRATADAEGRVSAPVALPSGTWTVVVAFDPTSYFIGPSSSPAVIDRSQGRRRAARH